jgi:fumarate hydratase subunit beta
LKKNLSTPLTEKAIKGLRCGDRVLLSGIIYTGRDAAHKRLVEILVNGGQPPLNFQGQIIYYVGPCPAKPGNVIGSAGPTTSGRMDTYTPALLKNGLKGMIGKGTRSKAVIEAMKTYGAIYFGAIGGAGALLSQCIKKAEVVAFDDLGPEAVFKLEVENLPLTVVVDCLGNDLYKIGREEYSQI